MERIPQHLKKYIVEQNYDRYTPVDQAVWRYCLRQLRHFLSQHGHESYSEGLKKTGISVESIPHISEMSAKLEKFGWRALPVSGFIPPAAFMELQSLSVLPIASDMRSVNHLQYTPAPDIVHEAAGHAPILVDPEYAEYLKKYAQVAKKALISQEDLNLYEAIRVLSDVKENPLSTPEEIQKADDNLKKVNSEISHISEASQLSRMNWWTAEYGLIGDLQNPRIFGAGLLSSVGESKWCLSDKVKKIPLTVYCIEQGYDITEPQPQLFVTPDFKTLVKVLEEMAEKMAFKVGGRQGLDKAIQAKSVNSVELENGLQMSGVVDSYLVGKNDEIIFVKLSGPTQICYKDHEIKGHDKNYHQHGYSSPLGKFNVNGESLATDRLIGKIITLNYESGFVVTGTLKKILSIDSTTQILTFENATATYQGQIYFQPGWGPYDVVTGHKVTSVFGGPADRISYGDTSDFVAARVPTPQYTDQQKKIFEIYKNIRSMRMQKSFSVEEFSELLTAAKHEAPQDWLIFIELLEVCLAHNELNSFKEKIHAHLTEIKIKNPGLSSVIDDGIALAHEI